ncbi:unnamed protein product, partial [Musa textilis]
CYRLSVWQTDTAGAVLPPQPDTAGAVLSPQAGWCYRPARGCWAVLSPNCAGSIWAKNFGPN